MEKETISAKSKEMLSKVFDLHYKGKCYFLIGEPHRKFNWRKLRYYYYQQVAVENACDNFEYIYNFGGNRTKEVCWSYTSQNEQTFKLIQFIEPEHNELKLFAEWANKIKSEINKINYDNN